MELIYCGANNESYARIAIEAGFLYGAQLPGGVPFPIWFADQNWKKPDRAKYMAALAEHRPHMASVLDLERADQLDEVLSWAEEAAQWVNVVMIIPKAFGIIPFLPRRIGGADVRLGYSIPTKHGGTQVPVWEFDGWPVHLLGGSPHTQMRTKNYFNVASADGNMMLKMANKGMFWSAKPLRRPRPDWVSLKDYEGERWQGNNAHHEAFRRSCENIMAAWQRVLA